MLRKRPLILENQTKVITEDSQLDKSFKTHIEFEGVALDKRLRKKRSNVYVQAMKNVDVHGIHCSREGLEQLIKMIQSEFPDLNPFQQPVGLVAKCYLGSPYEVHIIDVKHDIMEHFKTDEKMPTVLEKARSIAQHPRYEFIEVYLDKICAITDDGQVSIIKG
ncbi:hypothetical protein LG275_13080 [Chryseomicrobium palamuruense]